MRNIRKCSSGLLSHWPYSVILLLLLIIIRLLLSPPPQSQLPADYEKFAAQERRRRADPVPGEIRLLCMVVTTPANYLSKAVHVAATWGRD